MFIESQSDEGQLIISVLTNMAQEASASAQNALARGDYDDAATCTAEAETVAEVIARFKHGGPTRRDWLVIRDGVEEALDEADGRTIDASGRNESEYRKWRTIAGRLEHLLAKVKHGIPASDSISPYSDFDGPSATYRIIH
ncbi:MAG: hypothetical protein AAGF12_30320 [Myxococcota bacterium]